MLIPRRHYLALAGVEAHQFKALQRRDQLPVTSSEDASEDDAKGYTPFQAMLLSVAEHLVTSNSFSRKAAKNIAEGYWNVLPAAIRRAEAGEEIWYLIGAWDFGHDNQPDEDGDRSRWSWVEAGTFDEVVAEVKAEQQRVSDEHSGAVSNIAMFNLSALVQRAHARAAEIGLKIDSLVPGFSQGRDEAAD